MASAVTVKGVIRGSTIELERAPGLPDGQRVNVTVEPAPENRAPGDGIRQSAGAWADDEHGLDAYLEWARQQRKQDRRGLEP